MHWRESSQTRFIMCCRIYCHEVLSRYLERDKRMQPLHIPELRVRFRSCRREQQAATLRCLCQERSVRDATLSKAVYLEQVFEAVHLERRRLPSRPPWTTLPTPWALSYSSSQMRRRPPPPTTRTALRLSLRMPRRRPRPRLIPIFLRRLPSSSTLAPSHSACLPVSQSILQTVQTLPSGHPVRVVPFPRCLLPKVVSIIPDCLCLCSLGLFHTLLDSPFARTPSISRSRPPQQHRRSLSGGIHKRSSSRSTSIVSSPVTTPLSPASELPYLFPGSSTSPSPSSSPPHVHRRRSSHARNPSNALTPSAAKQFLNRRRAINLTVSEAASRLISPPRPSAPKLSLVVDVRPVAAYLDPDAGRYKDSVNVNFPSLLIKRFKKGNLSSFSLDSAITTERAKAYFRSLGKLDDLDVLVIDEDEAGTGAVLVGVWERLWDAKKDGAPSTLYYLKGSWEELRRRLPQDKVEFGGEDDGIDGERVGLTDLRPPRPSPSLPMLVTTPTTMTSSPIGSASTTSSLSPSVEFSRLPNASGSFSAKASRARLHPIDTSDSITRRPSLPVLNVSKARKSPSPLKIDRSFSHAVNSTAAPSSQSPAEPSPTPRGSLQSFCVHQRNSSGGSLLSQPQSSSPSTISPSLSPSEPFHVSSILPGSLYLGPEPTTDAEIDELVALGVKRVLNVALECDAEGRWDDRFEKVKRMGMRDWLEEKDVQGRIDEACDWLGVSRRHCVHILCFFCNGN
jgi:hypothetical protein